MILQILQLPVIAYLFYTSASNRRWIRYGGIYRLLYFWVLSGLLYVLLEFISVVGGEFSLIAFKLMMVASTISLSFFLRLTSAIRWKEAYVDELRPVFYVPWILSFLLAYSSNVEIRNRRLFCLDIAVVNVDVLMVVLLLLCGLMLAAGSLTLAYHVLTVHPNERRIFLFSATGIWISTISDFILWIFPLLKGVFILGFHMFILVPALAGMTLTARVYTLAYSPTEERSRAREKIGQGEVMVFIHEKPLHARNVFTNYLKDGFSGLYVSPNPDEANIRANTTLKIDISGVDGCVHPAHVNRLERLIWDFCTRTRNPVVLIEGLEEIMAYVGWIEALKFVDSLIDVTETTGALILFWVDPEIFDAKKFMLLSRHVKIM